MGSVSNIFTTIQRMVRRVFRRKEDARLRSLADLLDGIPMFSHLPRGMLLDLAGVVHERVYRKDEFLYYEGDPGIGLYAIRSGSVRLLVDDESGQATGIREMGPSEILGGTCLLGGGLIKRSESAQAVSETEVLGLFSPEFRTLQRRHPKTGAAVATVLARHFAQTLTETRRLLMERDGPVSAATCLAEARQQAASHSDPPPGW